VTRRTVGFVAIAVGIAAGLVAGLLTVGLPGSGSHKPSAGDHHEPSCAAKVKDAKVQTERRWTDDDFPGIGDYLEIHWEGLPAHNPCSRASGPIDWEYQGLVRLRPADAKALEQAYDWHPMPAHPSGKEYAGDTPKQMWPELARYAPSGARWQHSRTYADENLLPERWGDLYFDPDHDVAFFVYYVH